MCATIYNIEQEVRNELSQITSCVPLQWKLESMWSRAIVSGRNDKAKYIQARIHRLKFEEQVLGILL